ncbi:MAG: tRNA (adenosine(37)-N6)-threonylcarbamoyltransferase complex ATPase subunit type 1 TsaE [Clostridia bacterium]|nr:tRNA (adenosine(37)-N6)-threonylcarbamoyltransferase complex ATPase subunit type 1 TsaE [Clostridia bacterium]
MEKSPLICRSVCVSDTEKAGAELASKLKPGDFVALYGDLGAGKTAFVRGAASVLCSGALVCSPSYAIINRYDGEFPVYHIDLYRINDDDDLYSTGYYDLFDNRSVIFCEWCDRCPEAVPDNAIKVRIDRDGDERIITIDDTLD